MKRQSYGEESPAALVDELSAGELVEMLEYEVEPDSVEADDGRPPHNWRDAFPTLLSSIESNQNWWVTALGEQPFTTTTHSIVRVEALEASCWELVAPLFTDGNDQPIAQDRVNTLPLNELTNYVAALAAFCVDTLGELPPL